MANYFKMGLNLLKIAGKFVGSIIYNLSRRVKNGGFLTALTGTLNDDNAWIIDSGTSRQMIGESGQLQTLLKGSSSHSVELGDNNILYVPGLKKNLLSISCLDDKGDMIGFVYGKVLV